MRRLRTFALVLFCSLGLCRAAETNLISNGSFARSHDGLPEDWTTAGNSGVRQEISLDSGHDGGRSARLVCSSFVGDEPDSHAMLCQVGRVSIQRGRWYRLTFWAKAEGLRVGAVNIGLSNIRHWENVGLDQSFLPSPEWRPFELVFRATADLPADASRLQFWFKSAGTLWLDDVVLAETSIGQHWFPQISTDGVKNFIPNSSFECGTANWGGYTHGLSGWAGNVFRLEGALDDAVAQHGRHSLRLTLAPDSSPVYYFDYYAPVRQPLTRLLAANQGWFRVKPREPLTLSAWLRADKSNVAAELDVIEAPEHLRVNPVQAGPEWRRVEFSFTPEQPFLFIAVGLAQPGASLWIDSVQLERGEHATAYQPPAAVESFLETDHLGNIFTNPAAGLTVAIKAFNDSDTPQQVSGKLELTDFFDRVAATTDETLALPPHAAKTITASNLCADRQGFFRGSWTVGTNAPSTLRCAVIDPAPPTLNDSPLGFNHAYPWDFLVRLAEEAGIVWWRDWSAKWQTVEPHKGQFAFAPADEQIDRIRALGGQLDILLPFPSALWSSTARADQVAQAAGNDEGLRERLPVAYAPTNLEDFGAYAAAVARHYAPGVTYFQVLNESVYTDYSLPRSFGYGLADYIHLLAAASRGLRSQGPETRIVGGISADLDAGLTHDFITQGGLQWLDVFDLHMYDPPRPAESFDASFAQLEDLIRSNAPSPKPVWITEWGCYADDDPPVVPPEVGDASMTRCLWPNERAASEHIVKFTAVAFAHGVRKVFFHAGTCGTINGPDANSVLFEDGGAPRKMFPTVAALTRLLSVPRACLRRGHQRGLWFFIFDGDAGPVAILWVDKNETPLRLAPGARAFDLMGNPIDPAAITATPTPIYLKAGNAQTLLESLPAD